MSRLLTSAEISDIISDVLDYNYYHLTAMVPSMREFYSRKITQYLTSELIKVSIHPDGIPEFKNKVLKLFRRVDSGTAVGVLCGQSIGEKHTQMKLNTFHKAGLSDRNTSQDAPRFLEIVDTTQSLKQSCKACYVYLNRSSSTIKQVQATIGSDIVAIYFKSLVKTWEVRDPEDCDTTWYLDDTHRVVDESSSAVLHFELDLFTLFKYKITLEQVQERVEAYLNSLAELKNVAVQIFISPLFMGQLDIIVPEQLADTVQTRLFKHRCFGIEGIQAVFYMKDTDAGGWYIETEGSNLQELLKLEYVDGYRSYTNDYWEMYNLYGVDTVYQYLVHELDEILTDIHASHKLLLVDRMTRTGKLKSISRYTRKNEPCSIFSKATFEETLNIFTKSAMMCEEEAINGVSASIICSKASYVGTGMNELVYR